MVIIALANEIWKISTIHVKLVSRLSMTRLLVYIYSNYMVVIVVTNKSSLRNFLLVEYL